MAESTVDDVAAAEAARAQAEARRKRIMEKANKRLNLVSGETAVADEDKQESQSKAARIRAARQRRYKKKPSAQSATESGAAAEATATEEEPGNGAKEGSEEKISNPSPVVNDVPDVDADTDAARGIGPGKAEDSAQSVEEASSKSQQENAGDKKKYMGVAKMRRKKLLEKKKATSDAPDAAVSASASVSQRSEKIPSAAVSKTLSQGHKTSIFMHIVVVFLLFLAGVDVGIQVFRDDVTIHSDNVIMQHGLPVLHRSIYSSSQQDASDISTLQENGDGGEYPPDDDFQSDDPAEEADIDPIFGVDLDAITKDPTLINQLARLAIGVHRFILRFLYYAPLNFVYMVASIPQSLLETPPILCGVALILRQVVGKAVLGAEIPIAEDAEKKKEGGIDLVAMAKTGVSTFMSSTFPTAVAVYDAFSHLRSDMYVVMCGVFVGLLLTHTNPSAFSGDAIADTAASEEL